MKNLKAMLFTLSISSLGLSSAMAATEASSRIINGTQSDSSSWPFMTALSFNNPEAYLGQFCGGSFIGTKYILTAAHCVDTLEPEDFYVVIGQSDLQAQTVNEHSYKVQAVYVHADYAQTNSNDNDIAIIELAESVNEKAISTADKYLRSNIQTGELLTVMGWGDQDAGAGTSYSNHLYQVDVPLVDQNVCTSLGGDYEDIGDDAFCAGYSQGGRDSCQGDSGGPIVVQIGENFEQLGVVSWGVGCAQKNAYGVYANVSHFADWIEMQTAGLSYRQNERVGPKLVGQHQHSFDLTNHSDQIVTVTAIQAITADTNIVSENCSVNGIDAGGTCQVQIAYTVNDLTSGKATISLSTDGSTFPSDIQMSASYEGAILARDSVTNLITAPNDGVYSINGTWDSESGSIVSPTIFHNESTKLVITGIPKGAVTVSLNVSSEANFDEVSIFSNSKSVMRLSGEVTRDISVPLYRDSDNVLTLLYSKDEIVTSGLDRVRVFEITYSEDLDSLPYETKDTSSSEDSDNSDSGGTDTSGSENTDASGSEDSDTSGSEGTDISGSEESDTSATEETDSTTSTTRSNATSSSSGGGVAWYLVPVLLLAAYRRKVHH